MLFHAAAYCRGSFLRENRKPDSDVRGVTGGGVRFAALECQKMDVPSGGAWGPPEGRSGPFSRIFPEIEKKPPVSFRNRRLFCAFFRFPTGGGAEGETVQGFLKTSKTGKKRGKISEVRQKMGIYNGWKILGKTKPGGQIVPAAGRTANGGAFSQSAPLMESPHALKHR